jgi:hypothetical protein
MNVAQDIDYCPLRPVGGTSHEARTSLEQTQHLTVHVD